MVRGGYEEKLRDVQYRTGINRKKRLLALNVYFVSRSLPYDGPLDTILFTFLVGCFSLGYGIGSSRSCLSFRIAPLVQTEGKSTYSMY